MALSGKSSFLYGYEVTENNSSLDFKASPLDVTPRAATLRLGYYSLTTLMTEIKRAMQELDSINEYTVTADRTIGGGTQNRVTIATNGAFLELYFGTGPRVTSSVAGLIGFAAADQTGALTYTGTSNSGTILIPTLVGYRFLQPEFVRKIFGNVNISASGLKEAIVFQTQQFWQVEFKYEPEQKVEDEWVPFMTWAIQQKRLEFTPNISDPNTFYEGTLERTEDDGKGLGFKFVEMLPQFPNFYRTGLMTFRRG
jgi:hypothetical protein